MMRTFLPPSMRIAVSAGVPWSVAPAKSTVMLSPRITTPEIRYVRRRTRADRVITWPECSAIGALGPCVSRRASSSMVPTYASHATPAGQHGDARDWSGALQFAGHDRRLGPADPTAAPRQQAPQARRAHRGLFHLHRVQLRRATDPHWRPTAAARLPERRAIHMDAPALAAVAGAQRDPARPLQYLGSVGVEQIGR